MQRSNLYILLYTIALTVFCGVALAITKQALKPEQDRQLELERKKNILATFMTELPAKDKVESIYTQRVKDYVVNYQGAVVENVKASAISVEKESKKPIEERMYPVYEISSESNPEEVEYYVVPTWGKGLWDVISSYISVKKDGTTINGVVFNHKAETPGLGARIKDDAAVYGRYKDKQLFDGDKPVGVKMMKGEGNAYDDPHKVDGMSGATLTANGVNAMVEEYTTAYANFFLKLKKGGN